MISPNLKKNKIGKNTIVSFLDKFILSDYLLTSDNVTISSWITAGVCQWGYESLTQTLLPGKKHD